MKPHPAVTIIERLQAPGEYRVRIRIETPGGLWDCHTWARERDTLAESLTSGQPITSDAVRSIIEHYRGRA